MNETILIFFVIIVIYIFIFINRNNMILISSNGNNILLHKDNFKEKKKILLDDIIKRMYKLKDHLIKNKNNPDQVEFKEYWQQLENNFTESRTTIYETDPNSDLTSYSVNKGEELAICLRSKKENKLHEINLLMYVVIHEMAHFACPEVGHGDLFKKIFKKMIQEAINLNLYIYEDYSKNSVEYCGMNLSSSIL